MNWVKTARVAMVCIQCYYNCYCDIHNDILPQQAIHVKIPQCVVITAFVQWWMVIRCAVVKLVLIWKVMAAPVQVSFIISLEVK